jgi:phage shock protein A
MLDMGVLSRMSTIFKAKVSRVLDAVEDPRETLDYSYQRQLELLQQVKRSLADVATSRKQLELQAARLEAEMAKRTDEAKAALAAGREDLARQALELKAAAESTLKDLKGQIEELKAEEAKMVEGERRLEAKIAAFRAQKEVIKAQYSSAEAHVRMNEAATGISEELADVGLAVERAKDKTERMRARAGALDELMAKGELADVMAPKDPVEKELQAVAMKSRVDEELEALKKELGQ